MVKWVNPTGVSTPARSGTVATDGNMLQGTDEAVLGLVGEPLLLRVEWCGCQVVGRPELTTASSKAAAGVRVSSESALGSTAECADGRYGLLGVH